MKPVYTERNTKAPAVKTARPAAVIPVFPGTNCEYDTAKAVETAGGEAKIVVVRNLSHDALMRSAEELEQAIRGSQMMILPGGFSGATSRTAPVSSSLRSCVHRQSRTQCMTCSTTVTV